MGNYKYQKGAAFERSVIKDALEHNPKMILGMRGAGSKSYGKLKVDVILLSNDEVILIQCKKSKANFVKDKEEFFELPLPKTVKVRREFVIK